MDERTVEQRIRTAVDHAAPDVLDRILADCGPQTSSVVPFAAPRKKRRWAPLAAAAVLALVVCAGAFGVTGWRAANAVDSVVMLDVNPSVSMSVNARERVLSVTALNQDAVTIIGDMDLTGTDLDVAVNALIGSMLQNGYLSELQNAILVSVENQDAARSAQLQQHLTDTINSVFQGGQLEGAVLTQTVTETADLNDLAHQYGISVVRSPASPRPGIWPPSPSPRRAPPAPRPISRRRRPRPPPTPTPASPPGTWSSWRSSSTARTG